MILKKIYALCFSMLLSIPMLAQSTSFVTNYDIWTRLGSNNFHQTFDDGYILSSDAVHTMDVISDRIQGYLIKLDQNGNTQWTKQYPHGDPGCDRPQGNASVVQCSDSGYVIATTYLKEFDFKPYLIRTDANGNLLWAKQYPLFYGVAYCVEQTGDGGFVVVGSYSSVVSGTVRVFILKTDANGDVLFCNDLIAGTWGEGYPNAVREASDGGLIICGHYGYDGAYVIKLNAMGALQWQNCYSTNGGDFLDVTETASGDILACGFANPGLDSKIQILKLNASGGLLWQKYYKSTTLVAGIYAHSIKETSDQKILLGAAILPYVSGDRFHSFIMQLDAFGDLVWTKKYNDCWVTSVECIGDNSFAMSSQSSSYFTVPSAGDYLSVTKIDSVEEHSCPYVTVDILLDTFVITTSNPFTIDILSVSAITVTPLLTGIVLTDNHNCFYSAAGIENNVAADMVSIYPNPNNGVFTVSISLQVKNASVEVFNSLGSLVYKQEIINQENSIELSNEASGLYFVKVMSENEIVGIGKFLKQ